MTDVKRPPRRERAAATRLAIIRAAHELFCRDGYHGTTMTAIAKQAGVAVQTVYFVFHTKPQLMTATIDLAVLGEQDPAAPEDTSWYHDATALPDARASLASFVTGVTTILQRVGALDLVLRAGASSDPELSAVLAHHERLREDGYRTVAQSLAQRGFLRDGLTVDDVTDILMTMVGPPMYCTTTRDRSWDDQRYQSWTIDALCRLLLP